jgi:cytochrome c oxidase accessory protein FixG
VLHARPVEGPFRRLRWGADAALIAVLLLVPWIRIGGEPLVLLDVPARKFHVFGLVIFPQELYFLWLLVASLALALFLFTALLGRLWCGWACPQTVFTDVFAALARRIEGWRGHRRPAHVAVWRRVATQACWLAISIAVAFHLVAYFRSPYALVAELSRGALPRMTFGFLAVVSLLAYLDFAIVRQTFCKYLCPYARFQGVLFDRDTLVVAYDAARGEPRGKPGTTRGDCVDCGLCVDVCPTSIDIRAGLQLECIACTQCIDACDGVMDRLARPRRLIGYRSLAGASAGRAARWLRPRVTVYALLLAGLAVAFVALLAARLPLDLQVAHASASLYASLPDGRISNAFTLHIENRDRMDRAFRVRLDDPERFELLAGMNPIPVPAISASETRVFVVARAGEAVAEDDDEVRFILEAVDDAGLRVERGVRFLSPGAGHGG